MLVRSIRFCYKKIKYVAPESWVVKPSDASKSSLEQDMSHLDLKFHRDIKREYTRKR